MHNEPHASLLNTASHLLCWSSISDPLQRHPFSGLVHSAGELLHDSLADVLNSAISLIVKMKCVGVRVGLDMSPGSYHCCEQSPVRTLETTNSADLGGSSNDSKGSFED